MSTKSCRTAIIRDIPGESDLFESQSHESISNAISEMIDKNEGGITIGLSGEYGSGKSTIINILQKKYATLESQTRFVVFDVWAHEGNLLRYVFLKKVIDELDGFDNENKATWFHDNDLKENVKIHIENGKIQEVIPRNQKFLARLALYILLIPTLLSAFINGLDKGLFINFINPHLFLNFPLVIGLSLLLLPLFYFIPKYNKIKENGKILNFVINRNINDDSHELSSVEYDNWFLRVLNDTLSDGRKLVIIIDNLERISKEKRDSFLSTLQTFLQYSQNPSNKYSTILINRLWVIIPFNPVIFPKIDKPDPKHDNNQPLDVQIKDKRFQIIFDVPQLFLSDWEHFLEEKLFEAFPDHDKPREIRNIIYLFKEFYKNKQRLPREIITMVNQIGILHRQWCSDYPLDQIAFYVLYKSTTDVTVDKIRNRSYQTLACRNLFSPSELQRTLLGLYFNSTYKKAEELYLNNMIDEAFSNGDYDTISKTIRDFGEVAGTYIEGVLSKYLEKQLQFLETFNIWHSLFSQNIVESNLPKRKDLFVDHIKRFLRKTTPLFNLDQNIAEKSKELLTFFSTDYEIKKVILRLINPEYNPNSETGSKTLLEDIDSSAEAFVIIARTLDENCGKNENYNIVINSTEEEFFNLLVRIHSKSSLNYVKYIDFYSQQQTKGSYDFATVVKLQNYQNGTFTQDILGAFKILDELSIVYDKLSLFQRLSTLIIEETGTPELTDDLLLSINNLLDAILYYRAEGDYFLSQFITPLSAHQHGRIIRVFQNCVQGQIYNKAAEWLYIHFLCHPSKLEFPTKEYDDYDEQYLKKFISSKTNEKERVIDKLMDFFNVYQIDYLSWFNEITINEESISLIVSLLTKFSEEEYLDIELSLEWIYEYWQIFQSLPEQELISFIQVLAQKFNFETIISDNEIDFIHSSMYSTFIENSKSITFFQVFKDALIDVTEENWELYFAEQHPIFLVILSLIEKINYSGKDYFVINLKEKFQNAYSDFSIKVAKGEVNIDENYKNWSKLYLALNRNYQSGCRLNILRKLENLEGNYCDNYFNYYGDLLTDEDSLKRRETLINGILLPLFNLENENHLRWIKNIFSIFGKTIISKNSDDDKIVFREKLESIKDDETISIAIRDIASDVLTAIN